jgi:hypothetical protein
MLVNLWDPKLLDEFESESTEPFVNQLKKKRFCSDLYEIVKRFSPTKFGEYFEAFSRKVTTPTDLSGFLPVVSGGPHKKVLFDLGCQHGDRFGDRRFVVVVQNFLSLQSVHNELEKAQNSINNFFCVEE